MPPIPTLRRTDTTDLSDLNARPSRRRRLNQDIAMPPPMRLEDRMALPNGRPLLSPSMRSVEVPPSISVLETGPLEPPVNVAPSPTLPPSRRRSGAFDYSQVLPAFNDSLFRRPRETTSDRARRRFVGEAPNNENVERNARRKRAMRIIRHVEQMQAMPAEPSAHMDRLQHFLQCARLAETLFPAGELTGLDLVEVQVQREAMGLPALTQPQLTTCLRLAQLQWVLLPEGDVAARFDALSGMLLAHIPEEHVSAKLSILPEEPTRLHRYGRKFENALCALEKLRGNEGVPLYGAYRVHIGSLTALVLERIALAPRAVQHDELSYLSILLDECVEDTGDVVCGNGLAQRLAVILFRLERPSMMSVEAPTSSEQTCFSSSRFNAIWEKSPVAPSAEAIQDFFDKELKAFREASYPLDEVIQFIDEMQRTFQMAYGQTPRVSALV